ncbi:MAG TPA: hypothetical protein VFJ76_07890 [Solirubrobacterales bacterium]|nr:hypothetical protein [Solirubrobacterales bacterium]
MKRHSRQVRQMARIIRDGFEHVMSEADALVAAEKVAALPLNLSVREARAISELVAGAPTPAQEQVALKALGRLDSATTQKPQDEEER